MTTKERLIARTGLILWNLFGKAPAGAAPAHYDSIPVFEPSDDLAKLIRGSLQAPLVEAKAGDTRILDFQHEGLGDSRDEAGMESLRGWIQERIDAALIAYNKRVRYCLDREQPETIPPLVEGKRFSPLMTSLLAHRLGLTEEASRPESDPMLKLAAALAEWVEHHASVASAEYGIELRDERVVSSPIRAALERRQMEPSATTAAQ